MIKAIPYLGAVAVAFGTGTAVYLTCHHFQMGTDFWVLRGSLAIGVAAGLMSLVAVWPWESN